MIIAVDTAEWAYGPFTLTGVAALVGWTIAAVIGVGLSFRLCRHLGHTPVRSILLGIGIWLPLIQVPVLWMLGSPPDSKNRCS